MRAALEEILETSTELQGYLKLDSRMLILEQIIKALQDPDIKQISMSGIGGVGKTTLVKQVAVCAAELGLFDGVVKATFATQQLEGVQMQLADALGLKFNKLEGRGEQIHRSLRNGNVLVIVEDVWKWEEDRDLLCSRIGIPLGCKVLLTDNQFASRLARRPNESIHVSIGVLEEEEACRLFNKTVSNDGNHPDLDVIGKRVVERCKGMPVLIVTIAAALSERPTLSAWEDALGQLERTKNMELHEYVNSAVEFICYNYLPHPHKSLFLLCGLLQHIDGDQIAIRVLRSEWPRLEGIEGRPNLDGLIFDLKSSNLLIQGENSDFVKMHDLVRYAAYVIAFKSLKAPDVVQCSDRISTTKTSKTEDTVQYLTGGSVLGHTRLSRLLKVVQPDLLIKHSSDLQVKHHALLEKLKVLNRMNDLLSLVSSYSVTRKTNLGQWGRMHYMRSNIFSKCFHLNSVQLLHACCIDSAAMDYIKFKTSQMKLILEDILCYLPLHMIEDLGKVPELKALVETKMEVTPSRTHQYKYEEIREEDPVPKPVLELAVKSVIHHITTSIKTADWVGISGEGRNEVILAFKKDMAEKFKNVFLVSIGQIFEGDIINQSSSLYLIDLPERVDGFESIQGCGWWDLLTRKKIVFISSSPISCLPVDVQIRMEDHLLPWKLFCCNVGDIVHFSIPIRQEAGEIVKLCGGNLTETIMMAQALRDEPDVNVWKTAVSNFGAPESNRQDLLHTAVNLVLKRQRWSVITKNCIVESLSDCRWVDSMHLITRWRSIGVINSDEQGKEILNDLVDAFLFEYSSGKQRTRVMPELRDVISSILKPGQLVFHGIKGKVPTNEEWDCLEFDSGGTDLFQLPANPSCYGLQKLCLQDNRELTIIPPWFFESMEVLKVLNMSNTSIKTLPSSFFKLTTLTELVLRGCRLFMELPPQIGRLVTLTVLDLEGTEIIQLPVEVCNLINLTCLKVSFYGYGELPEIMIPAGILMKLRQLFELCIDVNPDDERWEENIGIVLTEVVTLQQLRYVKLYIPQVEQLYYLSKHFPYLIDSPSRRFHFTVGSHFRRIMSSTPLGVEAQFENRKKCLRYVHGSEAPVKQLKYALQSTTAFFLDRHHTVTKLSQFGTDNMKQLEFCVLGECSELETIIEEGSHSFRGDDEEEHSYEEEQSDEAEYIDEEESNDEEEYIDEEDDNSSFTAGPVLESLEYLIIYNMENLRSIWVSKLSIHKRSFCQLKSLRLHSCPQLSTIFSVDLLGNLGMLEELIVEDCESIEKLIEPSQPSNLPSKPFLPNIKKISLHYLPELVSISSGLHISPKLEHMSFYDCPNLKSLSDKEVSSKHLKKIRGEEEWWNGLQWDEAEWKEGRPSNLANIFIPFKEDEDLVTQLADNENPAKASSTADNENPAKASSTDTKPTPQPAPEKRQRTPSAYNRFIKDEIQRIKAGNPDISHREAFSAAAKNWAHFPHIGLMPDQTVVKKPNKHQQELNNVGVSRLLPSQASHYFQIPEEE